MSIRAVVFVMVSLFVPAYGLAQEETLPTGSEVTERAIKAMGGAEKFANIKTSVTEGTLEIVGVPVKGTLKIQYAAPRKMSVVATLEGLGEQQHGVNGDIGWEVASGRGARLASKNECDRMLEGVDMAMLVDSAKIFDRVTNEGIVETDGVKCYHVSMRRSEKDVQLEHMFFSVDTGLPKKMVTVRPAGERRLKIEVLIKKYKEFDGIKVPVETDQLIGALNMTQRVNVTSVKYNQKIDEDVFALPDEVKQLMKDQE